MDFTVTEYSEDYRNYLLTLVAEGVISKYDVILMLVKYMSNDDIADCLRINEVEIPNVNIKYN